MSCLERDARTTFKRCCGLLHPCHSHPSSLAATLHPPPGRHPAFRSRAPLFCCLQVPPPPSMVTTRECACPRCSRGVPDGTSLVSERAWFYHHQGHVWAGRGRKRPREARSAAPSDSDAGVGAGAGASGNPTECGSAATVAPAPADTAALPARSEGAADYAQPATAAASSPGVGLNGVCVPRSVFCERVDNHVTYTLIHKHRLPCEATLEHLSQLSRRVTSRTAKTLRDFVRASVDLHERRVDCCRNGCAAFAALRSDLDA